MITLYHGSSDIIEAPEIRPPNRTLDFGAGFYLTSSEQQAADWVRRRMNTEINIGYVNVYNLAITEARKELDVMIFDAPTEEWLDFVMSNRQIKGYTHNHDVVVGPVANDRVYTAFALYEGGTISKELLIRELKTYRLVDQYLIHTEKALRYLKFINAKKVER